MTWLRAHVVVDLANLAHQIGDTTGGGQVWPKTSALIRLLRHYGVETRSLSIALSTIAVERSDRAGDPARAVSHCRSTLGWVAAAAERCEVPLRILDAGTDGVGEVGVDLLAVADTILTAHRIEAGELALDGIVVLSADEDLEVAARYSPTRVYVAGRFDHRKRARLADRQLGYLAFEAADLASLAPGASPTLPPPDHVSATEQHATKRGIRAGDPILARGEVVRSSNLALATELAAAEREIALEGTVATVVADPYGTANTAARALGIAHLPTPGSLEALAVELGIDGEVAQLVTVPDVPDEVFGRLSGNDRRAWRERDRQLEQLLDELGPDDPRTVGTAARLAPERFDQRVPERRYVEQKRVTTTVLADTLWALLHRPDAPVLVVSEDPELVAALDLLAHAGVTELDRVVRVGLHPEPCTPTDGLPPRPGRPHLALLTEGSAARLCGLGELHFGNQLRTELQRVAAGGHSTWRVIRYDAETAGVVVQLAEDERLHLILSDALSLRGDVAEQLRPEGTLELGGEAAHRLELSFDEQLPCAVPLLRIQEDGTLAEQRVAVILDVGVTHLQVDTNGDSVGDVEVPIWHDTVAFQRGDALVIRRDDQGRWYAVAPVARASSATVAGRITVERRGDDAAARDSDGRTVELQVPGWWRARTRPEGRLRILAATAPGGACQPLSTDLPHLQTAEVGAAGGC